MGTSLLLALSLLSRGGTDTTLKISVGTLIMLHANAEPVQVRINEGDLVTVQGGTASTGNIETLPATNVTGAKPVVSILPGPARSPGQPVATLVVGVPAWATLLINSSTGDITLAGSPQELYVQTSTGAIRMDDGRGKATLNSVAGNVTVSRFQGSQLTIDTPGGDIGIYTAFGTIKASSTTGSITLRAVLSPTVSASTVNGQVQIDGPFASNGVYALESHNGAVTVFAPPDFSAQITFTVFKGQFLNEYRPGTVDRAIAQGNAGAGGGGGGGRGGRGGGAARGATTMLYTTTPSGERIATYGSGDTQFKVTSFNGNIIIRNAGGQ